MSITPRTRVRLASEGMEEILPLLEEAGLHRLVDIHNNGITEDDLRDIGIVKLFHIKKLMRLSREASMEGSGVTFGDGVGWGAASSRRSSASSPVRSPRSSRPTTPQVSPVHTAQQSPTIPPDHQGDHISVHVIAVRSLGEKLLSEREHYVKVSLCDLEGSVVIPIEGSVQRVGDARGPFPNFVPDRLLDTTPPINIPTNFRSHCLAFEVKERRLIGDNRLVGISVFPITYFHKFEADTVVDSWFTLRSATNTDDAVQTGQMRLRFTVPGGCPSATAKAFHVTAVNMNERKLRVTVFDVTVFEESKEAEPVTYFATPPSTSVSLTLDDADAHQKSETSTAENSFTPCFDETFEYFAEIARAKLLTVKVKERRSLTAQPTIGVVRIPLQFYLSQTKAADIDKVFDAFDHDNTSIVRARVHLRIEVRQRRGAEREISFMRTESIQRPAFLGGDLQVGATESPPGLCESPPSPTALTGKALGPQQADGSPPPLKLSGSFAAVLVDSEDEEEVHPIGRMLPPTGGHTPPPSEVKKSQPPLQRHRSISMLL